MDVDHPYIEINDDIRQTFVVVWIESKSCMLISASHTAIPICLDHGLYKMKDVQL